MPAYYLLLMDPTAIFKLTDLSALSVLCGVNFLVSKLILFNPLSHTSRQALAPEWASLTFFFFFILQNFPCFFGPGFLVLCSQKPYSVTVPSFSEKLFAKY